MRKGNLRRGEAASSARSQEDRTCPREDCPPTASRIFQTEHEMRIHPYGDRRAAGWTGCAPSGCGGETPGPARFRVNQRHQANQGRHNSDNSDRHCPPVPPRSRTRTIGCHLQPRRMHCTAAGDGALRGDGGMGAACAALQGYMAACGSRAPVFLQRPVTVPRPCIGCRGHKFRTPGPQRLNLRAVQRSAPRHDPSQCDQN